MDASETENIVAREEIDEHVLLLPKYFQIGSIIILLIIEIFHIIS